MVKEIGRILVSICLLILAGGLFWFGVKSPETAQVLGFGSMAGLIVGGILTYWLKP